MVYLLRKFGLWVFAPPMSLIVSLIIMTDIKHMKTTTSSIQAQLKDRFQFLPNGMASQRNKEYMAKEQQGMAFTGSKSTSDKATSTAVVEYVPRPRLRELIDKKEKTVLQTSEARLFIKQMLDFSIVGFGKCGTSTIMEWLHKHPQIQCIQEEVWALSRGKPTNFIETIYKGLPPNIVDKPAYKRGYKCPGDIGDDRVLNYYRRYWPSTKMFIGVRYV